MLLKLRPTATRNYDNATNFYENATNFDDNVSRNFEYRYKFHAKKVETLHVASPSAPNGVII